MIHSDTQNTSYGQKKGWEPNWQFDSQPLKVANHPGFLMCRCCATYRLKALNKGYNFSLDLISIESLDAKLWAPKVVRDPVMGISGFRLGSPRTKCHLDANPMANHRVYYKGEGGGFPQVQAMVSLVNLVNLVNLNLLVVRPSTKSASTMQ